jgi:hypothetical protein
VTITITTPADVIGRENGTTYWMAVVAERNGEPLDIICPLSAWEHQPEARLLRLVALLDEGRRQHDGLTAQVAAQAVTISTQAETLEAALIELAQLKQVLAAAPPAAPIESPRRAGGMPVVTCPHCGVQKAKNHISRCAKNPERIVSGARARRSRAASEEATRAPLA